MEVVGLIGGKWCDLGWGCGQGRAALVPRRGRHCGNPVATNAGGSWRPENTVEKCATSVCPGFDYGYGYGGQSGGSGAGHSGANASISTLTESGDWELGEYSISGTEQIDCSVAGTGFYTSTSWASVGLWTSAYQFAGVSSGRCAWEPSGAGCPGTCGSPHTTPMVGGACFTPPNFWKQCLDVVFNGQCLSYRVVCLGKPFPGFCN
jgi:hypothetical protein